MTARELGAVLARVLAILCALQASRYLMVLPGYAYATGLTDRGETSRWAWGMLGATATIVAGLLFGSLLLWRNAGQFWKETSGDLPPHINAPLLQRVALTVVGVYLMLTAAPDLLQTIVVLTMPDTDLGKFALANYSIWGAIANGIELVAGLALWYFNRQPSAVPTPLP